MFRRGRISGRARAVVAAASLFERGELQTCKILLDRYQEEGRKRDESPPGCVRSSGSGQERSLLPALTDRVAIVVVPTAYVGG
jgi:hypothetical protein